VSANRFASRFALSNDFIIYPNRFLLDSKKSDFGLPPDTDNDFHVKEIQDMISVVQRMIKDGKPIKYQKYRGYSIYISIDIVRNVQEKYVSKFLREKKEEGRFSRNDLTNLINLLKRIGKVSYLVFKISGFSSVYFFRFSLFLS